MKDLFRMLAGRVLRIYLLVLFAGAFVLLFYPKGTFLLWLNERHSPLGDVFFKYVTHLGDGALYGVILLILLCFNYYRALLLFIIVIVQTLPVQILKRFVFASNPRPKAWFANVDDVTLNFVEGVKIHMTNSFPSGHTATAFAIAFFLMYWTRYRWLQFSLLLAAIMVGISRIYLNLHFLADVWAGAIIGSLSSLVVLWFFEHYQTGLKEKASWQRGLFFRK
jgi:membrane-associated phospholipid phosphatase